MMLDEKGGEGVGVGVSVEFVVTAATVYAGGGGRSTDRNYGFVSKCISQHCFGSSSKFYERPH